MDDIDAHPSSSSIIVVPTVQSVPVNSADAVAADAPRAGSSSSSGAALTTTTPTIDREATRGSLPSAKQIDIPTHFDNSSSASLPSVILAVSSPSSSQLTATKVADPFPAAANNYSSNSTRPTHLQTSLLLAQPLEPVKEVVTPCAFHSSDDLSDDDDEEDQPLGDDVDAEPPLAPRRSLPEQQQQQQVGSIDSHYLSSLNPTTLPSQVAGPRILPLPAPVRQGSTNNTSLSTLEALQLKQLELHHPPIAPRPQQAEPEPEPVVPDKHFSPAAQQQQQDSASLEQPQARRRRRRRARPQDGKIRNFFISLRFFLPSILIAGLVLSSVLSWKLTFTTSEDSLDLVLSDYSNVLLTQFASDFDRRLLGVEHITFLNQRFFKNGFTDLYGRTDDMMKVFRTQLKEFAFDTTSGISVSTNTGIGFGYGMLFPLNQDPYMVEWYSRSAHNFTQSRVDSNGVPYLLEYMDENYNSTDSAWYQSVNISDPGSSGWSKPYRFVENWYVSFSAALYDSTKQPLGVITCDTNLFWIDHYCKQVAYESNINSVFVILDANTGMILGTSLAFSLVGNGSEASFLYSPNAPTILQNLHRWIAGQTNQNPDVLVPNFYLNVVGNLTGGISDEGNSYVVAVRPFVHLPLHTQNMTAVQRAWSNANGVEWLLVQMMEQTDVNEAMRNANSQVLGVVVGLIIGFAFLTGLLSWYSLGSIEKLSKRLLMLSRMDFVDDRISASNASTTPSSGSRFDEAAAKSFSVFSELRHMQVAGVEMVSAFKRHLLVRRKGTSMSAAALSYQQDPSRDFRPNSPFPINISIPSPAADPLQMAPPPHAQQTSSPMRGTSPDGNTFPERSLSTPLDKVTGPKLS